MRSSDKLRDELRLRAAEKALAGRIRATRFAIAAERFGRAFWPVWTLGFATIAAFAFGLPQRLSPEALIAVIVVTSVAAGALLWSGIKAFRWPTKDDAIRRLDDALPGRPLAALGDKLALNRRDTGSMRVWTRHLERMSEASKAARASWPDLALASRDRMGLRLMALVAILTAGLFAWRGTGPTLTDALAADPGAQIATGPSFEAWANPPVYTGKPTIYLNGDAGTDLELPVGTRVTLRVYGGETDYRLSEDVSGSDTALEQIAEGIQSADFEVREDGEFSLRQGLGTEAEWQVTVIPDLPPDVELTEPVDRTVIGQMELAFRASDDYGVVGGTVTIELDLDDLDRRFGLETAPEPREAITLDLPMPLAGDTSEFEETLIEDLSKHAWAGLPVRLSLDVTDAAGQAGAEPGQTAILPGRRFFDPLAKAVLEQRRNLLWTRENADHVSQMLRVITHRPDDVFTSKTAYLMTRMAMRRLGYAGEDGLTVEERDDVAELLWQVALLIEDGSLSDARERLRRAQERLSDALENGATEEEIAELMNELSQAMQDYMRQLAQEQMENGEMQQSQNQDGQEITQDQLQQMLDRIQELAENGQTQEAEELLRQLMEIMENLQMQARQGGQGDQGEQTLQELQDTLRQQQDLADESFQELQRQFQEGQQGQQQQGQQGQQQPGQQGQQGQGQQGQQGQQNPGQNNPGQGQQGQQGQAQRGPNGTPSADELARRQGALQNMLNDLRGRLPGATSEEGDAARRSLESAERNMGEAQDSLDQGDLPGALDRQADAMDALREGMRGLSEEMQQQAQQNQGQNGGNQNETAGRDNRDPLGRPQGTRGAIRTDDNMLPDMNAQERAQKLFDEIRRRSSDQTRPSEELDYLKRLLDRF